MMQMTCKKLLRLNNQREGEAPAEPRAICDTWRGRSLALPILIAALAFLICLDCVAAEVDNWPHPRGGLSGTGVAQAPLADHYEQAWTYTTGGAVLASPVIADGVVYVGSEDKHLHAIDATTGAGKWKFAAASLIDASAVVDEGVVYVGTDGGVLHAIDAKTGKEKWKFETGGRISGEPGITTIKDADGKPLMQPLQVKRTRMIHYETPGTTESKQDPAIQLIEEKDVLR